MLTVVDELNPGEPQSWQEAARLVVDEIFSSVNGPLKHLDNFADSDKSHLASSSGLDKSGDFLNLALECLSLLDIQFEGMLNNSKWFSSDQMYWVEEWKILGSLAAASGIFLGFLKPSDSSMRHPEIPIFSASAAPAGGMSNLLIQDEMAKTLIRKQMDYGPHNIARFGREGILVRCHDKIARLKNLNLHYDGMAQNESISDTYIDIIGYSAIGMMWERGWFLLNLTRD